MRDLPPQPGAPSGPVAGAVLETLLGSWYPRIPPWRCPQQTASRLSIRATRAPRLGPCATRFRIPSAHWSLLVRVMAPAHRDELAAVRLRLRSARFASPRPLPHRAPRSAPALPPRWRPTVVSTSWSAPVTNSRVRTRAPVGRRATNGARIERLRLTGRPPHPAAAPAPPAPRCELHSAAPSPPGCGPTAAHTGARRTRSAPRPCRGQGHHRPRLRQAPPDADPWAASVASTSSAFMRASRHGARPPPRRPLGPPAVVAASADCRSSPSHLGLPPASPQRRPWPPTQTAAQPAGPGRSAGRATKPGRRGRRRPPQPWSPLPTFTMMVRGPTRTAGTGRVPFWNQR